MTKIGFIGGSGLYDFDGFQDMKTISMDTPFGKPSSEYVLGIYDGKEFVFLPRHGKDHEYNPTNINFRANIYGFKKLGITNLFSMSAVGSMKLKLKLEHIVVPDQFIDITRTRKNTFFDEDIVVHCSLADPVCPSMLQYIQGTLSSLNYQGHIGGTYICIEGPHFSSRAESFLYKSWGVDIIGMTNATEAKLCKEAEICYCSLAFITDYDCWHSEEEDVSTVDILQVLKRNSMKAKTIIKDIMNNYVHDDKCNCQMSLKNSIITPIKNKESAKTGKYSLFFKKYI